MAAEHWRTPLWLTILGNLCLATVVFTLALLLLPRSLVGRSKLLRRWRQLLVKQVKRMLELSKEGPFYRLFVWCGRRCSLGRASSRCRAVASVKLKATGWNEMEVRFSPCLPPVNPFHEEDYILSWKLGEREETRPVKRYEECEELSGGSLRMVLDGLPEQREVEVRIRAVNVWGAGAWSERARAATLARPVKEGGFTGPLGPAGAGEGYRWTQSCSELNLSFPISAKTKAKDIKFKAFSSRLEIRIGDDAEELLVGPLHKRIKADEATWEIEDSAEEGRRVVAQFMKAEQMEKWACLVEGHPKIDVKLVRLLTNGLRGMGGLDIFE